MEWLDSYQYKNLLYVTDSLFITKKDVAIINEILNMKYSGLKLKVIHLLGDSQKQNEMNQLIKYDYYKLILRGIYDKIFHDKIEYFGFNFNNFEDFKTEFPYFIYSSEHEPYHKITSKQPTIVFLNDNIIGFNEAKFYIMNVALANQKYSDLTTKDFINRLQNNLDISEYVPDDNPYLVEKYLEIFSKYKQKNKVFDTIRDLEQKVQDLTILVNNLQKEIGSMTINMVCGARNDR